MAPNVIDNTILLSNCVAALSSGALTNEAILSDYSVNSEQYSYQVEYAEDSTTNRRYTASSLIEKAIDTLEELSRLPVGWDSYGSPRISDDIIDAAKNFLGQLEYEYVEVPHIIPISGGGIQFEWQVGDRELELEFIDSVTISFLKVRNDEPIEENQFNRNDFNASRNVIQWLKGF
ncbi:MAG: hypothetical protein FVQ80_00250 [Planctomycetes bacterium]|nr:hypothetical protein [Planctomycetota bacterium]